MRLSLEQQDAVDMCLDKSEQTVCVTGGAGTGKTTILRSVYDEFLGKSCILTAPTGRAAKRIEEATGIKARTIHRLLEFPRPDDDAPIKFKGAPPLPHLPKRNRNSPLVYKVILVDESSMIGRKLYNQLMDALPPGGIVRFFGDNNQLPPVEDEHTAPFRKMIVEMPTAWLTFNFRSEDAIIGNALRVLKGQLPIPNDQFKIIYSDRPLRQMLQMADNIFTTADAQIITPTRRGGSGTMVANPYLQMKFNPKGDYLKLDRLDKKEKPIVVRQGDKFLWVKNDYNFDIFNGEIGTIDGLDDESGELLLGMVDRKPLHLPPSAVGSGPYGTYIYDPRKQIELGYAATTHKAQGSEFRDVIYYMSSEQPYLLNRNNFYTGITRAKKFCVVICDRRAMRLSISRSI